MVFDVFVVDSPSGYNLGKINDIVQSTQQEQECAQIMNMYIVRRRPKIEFCGSYFGYSMVMFDFCCLFVCLFVCLLLLLLLMLLLSPNISIYVILLYIFLKTNICKH